MWPNKKDKELGYAICENSCACEMINKRKKLYKVNSGSLVKLFEFNNKTSVGLMVFSGTSTILMAKSSLYKEESLSLNSIEHKLFKYLYAIDNFEERLKFYRNAERLEFVQRLKKDSIVGVSFSNEKQIKAEFLEFNEKPDKIFITVELLEKPSSLILEKLKGFGIKHATKNCTYSLPANMIRTFINTDRKNHENLQNDKAIFTNGIILSGYLNGPVKPENRNNNNKTNVRINKSSSVVVVPPKTKINSQNATGSSRQENYDEQIILKNKTLDTSYNKVSSDEPKNDYIAVPVGQHKKFFEKFSKTPVYPALIVSSNSSTKLPTNSSVSVELSKVCDTNICISNDDDKEEVVHQNNSQTNDDLNNETPISSLEINTHVTDENDLADNLPVERNKLKSNCIICKSHLDISAGFVLIFCKHTFCETCIKNRINLKMLDHTNMMPCCDRLIELDEIKYFLNNQEYEQFKAFDIQQCFDKNCSGYYLREKRDEARPIKYTCNKCEFENCLKCGTIHVNLTCEQYDKITGEGNSVDKETVEVFLTWIREGTAMLCPHCEALIEKDEGCDWVQCNFCNTEICWATRGRRWGPDGKGDTSGGCGCDFKVKKCVENCNYCH